MTRRWGCVFAVLSILAVSASLSAAAEPPSKKITLSGRGFPAPVTVVFAAQAGYTSGFGGAWTGPRWSSPTSGGDSGLTVNVGSDDLARSAEQAARNKLGSSVASWTVVATEPIAVPHLVGARKVGTFKGFFLILHKPEKGYEGWYKAAVGVPLGKGYPLLAAVFLTTTPSSDASQTIEGKTPSVWNRQAIEQALRGMAVERQLAAQPAAQPARCLGMPRTVSGTTGTAGDDVIIGSSGNDTLRGLGGNDTLCGGAGNDTISAGAGDDYLDGGDGDDRLDGGGGTDRLRGGEGSDRVEGGPGDDDLREHGGGDNLYGNAGKDKLYAFGSGSTLDGGAGNDWLEGSGANDTLNGGAGNDELRGHGSHDTLNGGSGEDSLYGGNGQDRLNGGSGRDKLRGGESNDRLRGGPGNDQLWGGGGTDNCDSIHDQECETEG